MSDEENQRPEFSMFYLQLPPEVQAEFDRQQMVNMQNAHDGVAFFDSLDENQMRVFRGLLNSIRTQEGAVDYYMGLVSAMLNSKFGVCIACSQKHDEELKHMAGQGEPPQKLSPEDREALMKEFSVAYVGEGERVMCTNCGAEYPNLEDRMMKVAGPAGCGGCIQKTKWG